MSMFFDKSAFLISALVLAVSGSASKAAELIMVESPGCYYCIEWKKVIGPIYPKTEAGQFAPLVMVDKSDSAPFDGGYSSPVVFTPTFVLVDDGQEIGRIQGYPGEDFFWALLEQMLEEKTEFKMPG